VRELRQGNKRGSGREVGAMRAGDGRGRGRSSSAAGGDLRPVNESFGASALPASTADPGNAGSRPSARAARCYGVFRGRWKRSE